MTTRKTKHEKELELASAAAPKYGIYMNGGDAKDLVKALNKVDAVLKTVMNADASESTKRMALNLIKETVPSVSDVAVHNCSIQM